MSESRSSRNTRRVETPVEVLEYRDTNYDGLRDDAQTFIDSTYRKVKQCPGMLKDGQGVHKRETAEVWNTGTFHCRLDMWYTEGKKSKGGRPKKKEN